MLRIRRTRAPVVVDSPPSRIRRVRAAVEVAPVRVRRTRPVPAPPSGDPRKRFIIDWQMPLGGKLQLYLLTSFLYYEMCRSVITDHDFDRLCKELAEGWDTFDHQHKHCTSLDDMVAGTGYANKYPLMVRAAADALLREFYEV